MNRAVIRRTLARASAHLGLGDAYCWLNRRVRAPYLRAVNYHEIEARHADGFRRQLECFASRFTVMDEAALAAFFAGTFVPPKPGLLICFDDGQDNNHTIAAPLLEEHGLSGWFFIIAGYVASSRPASDGTPRRYMGWDAVRDLSARGHTIGCHTYSHPIVAGLPEAALHHEILGSRAIIEEELGTPVRSFLFPYGTTESYDRASIALAASSYAYVFTSCPGFITPSSPKGNLGRVPIEPYMDLDEVRFLVDGLFDARQLVRTARYARILSDVVPRAVP